VFKTTQDVGTDWDKIFSIDWLRAGENRIEFEYSRTMEGPHGANCGPSYVGPRLYRLTYRTTKLDKITDLESENGMALGVLTPQSPCPYGSIGLLSRCPKVRCNECRCCWCCIKRKPSAGFSYVQTIQPSRASANLGDPHLEK